MQKCVKSRGFFIYQSKLQLVFGFSFYSEKQSVFIGIKSYLNVKKQCVMQTVKKCIFI